MRRFRLWRVSSGVLSGGRGIVRGCFPPAALGKGSYVPLRLGPLRLSCLRHRAGGYCKESPDVHLRGRRRSRWPLCFARGGSLWLSFADGWSPPPTLGEGDATTLYMYLSVLPGREPAETVVALPAIGAKVMGWAGAPVGHLARGLTREEAVAGAAACEGVNAQGLMAGVLWNTLKR